MNKLNRYKVCKYWCKYIGERHMNGTRDGFIIKNKFLGMKYSKSTGFCNASGNDECIEKCDNVKISTEGIDKEILEFIVFHIIKNGTDQKNNKE